MSNPNATDAYETAARLAGWKLDERIGKWWHPENDDGSRYCDIRPRCFRYICEDHGLEVIHKPAHQRHHYNARDYPL